MPRKITKATKKKFKSVQISMHEDMVVMAKVLARHQHVEVTDIFDRMLRGALTKEFQLFQRICIKYFPGYKPVVLPEPEPDETAKKARA